MLLHEQASYYFSWISTEANTGELLIFFFRNQSICEYLRANGYIESYEAFKVEANIVSFTSLIRVIQISALLILKT